MSQGLDEKTISRAIPFWLIREKIKLLLARKYNFPLYIYISLILSLFDEIM